MNLKKIFASAIAGALFLGSIRAQAADDCPISLVPPDNGATVIMSAPWAINFPNNDTTPASNPSYISNYVVVGNAAVPPGYYKGWCVDAPDDIDIFPTLYDAVMYSSCDPNLPTYLQALGLGYPSSVYVDPATWKKVNYILNHRNGAYFWDVQLALWTLVGGPAKPEFFSAPYPPTNLGVIAALLAEAEANAATWEPKCGDVIAVVVAVPTWTFRVQLTIIEVPIPCEPCIKVSKVVACFKSKNYLTDFDKIAAGFKANDPAQFVYGITITNCGPVALTNVSVIDSMFGDITTNLLAPGTVFQPGATASYYYQAGLEEDTTNVVVVTGYSIETGAKVDSSDSAVALVDSASIKTEVELYSDCDEDGDAKDNHVLLSACKTDCVTTIKIKVCNTGASRLTNVKLSSTVLSQLGFTMPTAFDLAPGECKTFSKSLRIKCPGTTFNVSVTGKVAQDAQHCGIYDCTGKNVLSVEDSDTGIIKCGTGRGSICGYVFLDCDGNGNLAGGDVGLKAVPVYLKTPTGSIVAQTKTGADGGYCFTNVAAGKYVVMVVPPSGYQQTAGSTKPQWRDSYGRHCWKDNDGRTHWKENGLDCWMGDDGYKRWKSNGYEYWKDRYGRTYSKLCGYKGANDPKDNKEEVTVSACGSDTDVNFAYKGTSYKAVCVVKGPSSVRCGETATYTATISNTGNGCFTKGGKVNICGKTYSFPALGPGESYTITCKVSFSYWDAGTFNCKAVAECYPSSGYAVSSQSYCTTTVRR